MKRTLLATAVCLAFGVSNATAGVIQIDPTGSGSIGGSIQTNNPGSIGSALGFNAVRGPDGNGASSSDAIFYAQAVADISVATGIAGAQLTYVLSLPVSTAVNDIGTGGSITFSPFSEFSGSFKLYYDDAVNAGLSGTDAGSAANLAAGDDALTSSFTDGALLATGSIKVLDTGGSFGFSQQSAGTAGPLSVNDATPSINGNGSLTIGIDFTPASVNTAYVVNDLAGLVIDVSTFNPLSLRFQQGVGGGPIVQSSGAFDAGLVTPNFGLDGENDLNCGEFNFCDLEMQMGGNLLFTAPPVPEPGTLALLGLGLGLFGFSRKRARS